MKRDQIFNELKQRIATGEYAAGEKLPTEFELSAQYAVARGTVRQSLKRLEEEGYLERIKSKGTFIRRPPRKIQCGQGHLFPDSVSGLHPPEQ